MEKRIDLENDKLNNGIPHISNIFEKENIKWVLKSESKSDEKHAISRVYTHMIKIFVDNQAYWETFFFSLAL